MDARHSQVNGHSRLDEAISVHVSPLTKLSLAEIDARLDQLEQERLVLIAVRRLVETLSETGVPTAESIVVTSDEQRARTRAQMREESRSSLVSAIRALGDGAYQSALARHCGRSDSWVQKTAEANSGIIARKMDGTYYVRDDAIMKIAESA